MAGYDDEKFMTRSLDIAQLLFNRFFIAVNSVL